MDSLTRKETPDRNKINMQSAQEVKCWIHELGITREQLQKLVDKVGNAAATVRKELEREKNGGAA
jgi:hypothetical protein